MLTHVMMAVGHFNAIRIYVTYVHEVIHLVILLAANFASIISYGTC